MCRSIYLSTRQLSLPLLVFALVAYAPTPVGARVAPPDITCASCLLVDDYGGILFARSPSVRRPNASTTKMVTALVVRDRARLDEEVRVSAAAAATGGGGLDLEPGGGYDVEELLLALLLTSSNDAAVALAEHVAGSEERFVSLLNRTARRAGWTGTSFVTPHGLDRPGHFSTARDLADIAERVLADRVLADMVATSEIAVTGPEGVVVLENRNLLLEGYRGATGVKTGFTALAGNVLVASARRSGRTLIAVVMDSVDAAGDARALLDYGFARLRRTVLLSDEVRQGSLLFDGSGSTGVVAREVVRGPVAPEELKVEFVVEPGLSLPVEAGEAVGVLKLSDARGRAVATVDALAEKTVRASEPSLLQSAFSRLLEGASRVFGEG